LRWIVRQKMLTINREDGIIMKKIGD